jgi:outer membrane protein TolC
LKYEQAKKQYIFEMENVASRAIRLFFDLALAQLNLEIAKTNYSNADTLYKIAQGRFNIGTIAENELLQMELSKLNSATELNRATIDLISKKAMLGSFLGYNESVDIQITLPKEITPPILNYEKVLNISLVNNPELLSYDLQLLNAEREVARTRADNRFTANLYAQYGLNKSSDELKNVYKDPDNMQMIQFGVRIPLVDWGLGKGKYKMAQSNRELIKTVIDQQKNEFEQDVFLKVMQFNLQEQQIKTANKADTVAQLRYELSKQRFLIGKISITDLNIALNEKDIARRGYINTMQSYYSNLFDIRKLCLYDFEKDKALEENFESLEK